VSEGKETIKKRSMNFLDIFVCVVSLCFIFLGMIIRYGKYNDWLLRFNVLSDEQKKRISRMYQTFLFSTSCLLLGGLFIFHYYNIYHYFGRYIMIIFSLFCFCNVFLGLHTSSIIEKKKNK